MPASNKGNRPRLRWAIKPGFVCRRSFIKAAVLFSSAAAHHRLFSQQPAGPPTPDFPEEPRRRLALTSYPFRAFLDFPGNHARDTSKRGVRPLDFPQLAATEFGIENINPLGAHLGGTDPAALEAYRQAVQKAGSHIVDLGLGGMYFASADPQQRDAAIAYGRKWIDIAKRLGAPSVRQHLETRRGEIPVAAHAAESLSHLADYAAEQGIVINLENDSPGAEDSFFIVEVIQKVNSPYLRALADFGNSIRGHDAAYNRRAVSAMLDHVWNMCHVKETLLEDNGKTDRIDLPEMFALARARHYRGYFSMEFDTETGDPFAGTKQLVARTLECLRTA